MSTLHVVEVGGEGGVYQHVLGAAEHGVYKSWNRVIVHTAQDAETCPQIDGLEYHKCMRWQRRGPRLLRQISTVAWMLFVMLPHLAWDAWCTRSDWEIQGQFGRGFYILFIIIPRLSGRRVVFSPHNSFLRHGGWWEAPILTASTRLATKTVVYVPSEASNFASSREIEQRVLWQYAPQPDEKIAAAWRKRLVGDRFTILFAGQLRHDKNPLLLIEAINRLETPVNLVFAGQDKGAASAIRNSFLSGHHLRYVEERYLDLVELVTLIDLCDILVCPYQIASQSGVVALANQLDRQVVVSSAGGLREQSRLTFDLGENQTDNLASVLRNSIASRPV